MTKYLKAATYYVGFAILFVNTAHPENLVRVDRLSNVAPNATGVTIGVYITNDVPMSGFVLPLEIRSCGGGAYMASGGFVRGLNASGRMNNSPLGVEDPGGLWPAASITNRTFAAPVAPAAQSCVRAADSTTRWNTQAALPDFVSPDAIFLATVSTGDPGIGEEISMAPGADPPGTPSYRIVFNVGPGQGLFVIDTTCVAPANHLAFVTINDIGADVVVVPAFVSGFVGVGTAGYPDCAFDIDQDGIPDDTDNCPLVSNPNQSDVDGDMVGDVCDNCVSAANVDQTDSDGDGIGNVCDNCSHVTNALQEDVDGDGTGDACDNCPNTFNPDQQDSDGDGIGSACDNCLNTHNADQQDSDGDGIGDVCDPCPFDAFSDTDGDGICLSEDNCPDVSNAGQEDTDGDGHGDACDNCPLDANSGQEDSDSDGIGDACDNCPFDATDDSDGDGLCFPFDNCPSIFNPDQLDSDNDGVGDVCDNCLTVPNTDQLDSDGDGLGNACDNCRFHSNTIQTDTDLDGVGDACDNCPVKYNPLQENADGDVRGDSCDNCIFVFNASQTDADGDGLGNACDPCPIDPLNDDDFDGICGGVDNCPFHYNPGQQDSDGDGKGDVCDCACDCHTDPLCDGIGPDILDVTAVVNTAFRNATPDSDPNGDCPRLPHDVNCDGSVDILDVVHIVTVSFRDGVPTEEFCQPCQN